MGSGEVDEGEDIARPPFEIRRRAREQLGIALGLAVFAVLVLLVMLQSSSSASRAMQKLIAMLFVGAAISGYDALFELATGLDVLAEKDAEQGRFAHLGWQTGYFVGFVGFLVASLYGALLALV